jgi:Predicted integral membrane protein
MNQTKKELKASLKAEKKTAKRQKKEAKKAFKALRFHFIKTVFHFIAQSPLFLFYSLGVGLFGIILLGIALISFRYAGAISFLYFLGLLFLILGGWSYAFNFYYQKGKKDNE